MLCSRVFSIIESPAIFSFIMHYKCEICDAVGVWNSPATFGERPPPCSGLTITALNDWTAVVFGGYSANQHGMNDVYLIDLSTMVCLYFLCKI